MVIEITLYFDLLLTGVLHLPGGLLEKVVDVDQLLIECFSLLGKLLVRLNSEELSVSFIIREDVLHNFVH
jgi:hypothetical protein